MNDLVIRLRQHDGHLGFLVEEAADEIERLQREITTLRNFLKGIKANADLALADEQQPNT